MNSCRNSHVASGPTGSEVDLEGRRIVIVYTRKIDSPHTPQPKIRAAGHRAEAEKHL